jgi:indole-3-acetate monooxygenase
MARTANRLLLDIQDLAPDIATRAAEIEAARDIPSDLVEALRSIGIYRMFVPHSHGGLELDLPDGFKVLRALARIEPSVGWTAMISCVTQIFAPLMQGDIYDEVYRNGPDVIMAGSNQPVGTAEAAPGGWRVSGRWPLASGCRHAEFIGGSCVMTKAGKPLPGPIAGAPLIRIFFLPAGRHWQIEDSWHAAGLKGTGSSHVAIKDAFVPAENFFDLKDGAPCVPGPLYQAPMSVIPLLHGPFSVGVAEGALDDLIALAGTGRTQFLATTSMRDAEFFQYEMGRLETELRAAEAFVEAEGARCWQYALARRLRDETLFVRALQNSAWLSQSCIHIVDQCFALGGSSVVYETSPLQRRLRDLHVAGQHFTAQQRNYVSAGKLLLNPPSKTETKVTAPAKETV